MINVQKFILSHRDKISITTGEAGGNKKSNLPTLKGLNMFLFPTIHIQKQALSVKTPTMELKN